MTTRSPETKAQNATVMQSMRASFRKPGFVTCVAALTLMTVSFYALTRNIQFRKEAAPLRRPLGDLDKSALGPYRFVEAEPIPSEVLDALGTTEYLQWLLEDESVPDNDPAKQVQLFITYYTGQPDPVPHVPEICYLGGGFKIIATQDGMLDIAGVGPVLFRILEFEKAHNAQRIRPTVIYTFKVNGQYVSDRNAVREAVSSPLERYAYFAKIEVQFWNKKTEQPATRDQAQKAARKLFQVLLPELERSHWPDWKALHASAAPADK